MSLIVLISDGFNLYSSLKTSIWSLSFPRTILKANLVPFPCYDFTPIVPPKVFTMFSEITKPNPIPLVFIYLVFYRVPKSLNNLILSLFLIPIPVSITVITNLSLPISG